MTISPGISATINTTTAAQPRIETLDVRAALRDMGSYLPSTLVPALAGFLLIPVLTHLLTPSQYGTYAVAGATISLAASFSDGWLINSVLRFHPRAEGHGEAQAALRLTALLAAASVLCGAALVVLAALILPSWLPSPHLGYMGIVLLLCSMAVILDVGQSVLRASRQVGLYSVSMSLRSVAKLSGAGLGGLLASDHLLGAMLGWVTATGVVSLASLLLWLTVTVRHRRTAASPWKTSSVSAREFLAYGIPLSLSLVLNIVLSEGDRFLLQWLRGAQSVGLYSAAYTLVNSTLSSVNGIPIMASFPLLIRVWERQGVAAAASLAPRLLRIFALLALPTTVAAMVLTTPALAVVAPGRYVMAGEIAGPVALGVLLLGLAQYLTLGLLLAKRTRMMAGLLLVAAISNLALNVLLIPSMGIMGSAVATTAAYGLYALLGWLKGREVLMIGLPAGTWVRAIVAAGGAGIVMLVVTPRWHGLIGLGAVLMLGAIVNVTILIGSGELPIKGARQWR